MRHKFVVLLPAAIASLLVPLILVNPSQLYMALWLYTPLTLLFNAAIPLAISLLAARAYVRQGLPGVLPLGCGMVIFGFGSMLSALGHALVPDLSINFMVSIFNVSTLVAASFFTISAIRIVSGKASASALHDKRWITLGVAYALAVMSTALIASAISHNILPHFFIQGYGSTPARSLVLQITIILLAIASSILMLCYWSTRKIFLYWYSTALFLIMLSIVGISFQTEFGSLLNWFSRIAQYLGDAYLLIAAIVLRREAKESGFAVSDVFNALFTSEIEREKVEQALKESEERLRLATDTAGLGFFDWDIRTGKTFFSLQWKSQLGYEEHEISNSPEEFESRLHPQERDSILNNVREYLNHPYPDYKLEFRLRHRNGTYRTIHTRTTLIADATGNLCRMIGTHLDVTERKQAEETLKRSEQQLQTILENVPGMVYLKDSDNRFRFVNRTMEHSVGLRREDILGKTPREIFPREIAERMSPESGALLASPEPTTVELSLPMPDGPHVILNREVALRDASGEVYAVCGIATDITEHKLMERALTQAKEEAEAASQAKSSFLANMSHEIRTPLTGIIGLTQMAMNQTASSETRECLRMILDSSQSLFAIVNDILDFSKIEAGRMEFLPVDFDLRSALDRSIKALRFSARQKGLKLSVRIAPDVPEVLHGDPERIMQVVRNLVGNALKFTDDGEVAVEFQVLRQGDPMLLECLVRDTGIGIPNDRLPELFQVFSQLETARTKRFAGTGLGLAISRRLVEMMGGTIEVESQPGQGSTFVFTVSLRPAQDDNQEAACVAAASPSADFAGLCVLLAEDNLVNRVFLKHFLIEAGCTVRLAGSGGEVLALLAQEPVDLVLMDIQMPEMDGVEATRRIRNGECGEELRRVPVVALTAYSLKGDRERFLSVGLDDYVSKPVDVDELFVAMHRVLQAAGWPKSAPGSTL